MKWACSGHGFGAPITATGELAIQTSNFGYQEAISDPANFGKILAFMVLTIVVVVLMLSIMSQSIQTAWNNC